MAEVIKDDDLLGRAIFSSRTARRAEKGLVDMCIFLERPEVLSLSVDRFGFCSTEKLTNIQNKNAKSRTCKEKKKRSFYGWVKIKTKEARNKGRTVQATPTNLNPYHADIILPKNITRDEAIIHAKELASNSIGWEEKSGE